MYAIFTKIVFMVEREGTPVWLWQKIATQGWTEAQPNEVTYWGGIPPTNINNTCDIPKKNTYIQILM